MNKDILIRSDNSEIFEYNYPDFPVYAQRCRISAYPRFRATAHWHEDLELIMVLEGEMVYEVNGKAERLCANEGIWVNSRQLHSLNSPTQAECIYLCVLLHPSLLSATDVIALNYVSEYLSHPGLSYCLLREAFWQKEILLLIQSIYDLSRSTASPLRIQGKFLEIWATLTENLALSDAAPKRDAKKSETLKKMMQFLYSHYAEPITLKQIAAAGSVGKSACTEIFKIHLHETPVNYLIQHRLRKGAELLRTSGLSVTEIAYNVGFSNPSYFASTFRETYDCSPSEYRNKGSG